MPACVPLLLATLAVASAVPLDNSLDDRLKSLDAHITALALNGNDAPDALVKEKTGGEYTSCAHVAAQGLCGHELAQMSCAKSCKATKVKSPTVTAQKGDDPVDSVYGKKSCGKYCGFSSDCESGSCLRLRGHSRIAGKRCLGYSCCYMGKGADYAGNARTTVGGLTCQAWDSDTPHSHQNHGAGPENFCRNPDGEPRPWCYTTDPGKRWDFCAMEKC